MKYFKSISVVALLTTMLFMGTGVVHALEANTAFEIVGVGPGIYRVYVGIDVLMSRQEAQNILVENPQPFVVTIWGDDWSNNFRVLIPVAPGWPQVWDGGLSAEFNWEVGSGILDENNSWTDEHDELYARIELYHPITNEVHKFYTSNIEGDF